MARRLSEGKRFQDHSQEHAHAKHRIRRTNADWFGFICMCLMVTASILLAVTLCTLNMLPLKYFLLAIAGLAAINVAHAAVQIPIRRNKGSKLVCGGIAIVLSAVMLYGFVASSSLQSAINKISSASKNETKTVDVVVLKNNAAQSIADVQGETFGILANTNAADLQKIEKILNEQAGEIKTTPYASTSKLADALYNGATNVMIIDDALFNALSEIDGYTSILSDTRILYQFSVVSATEVSGSQKVDITKEPFVVYLSGSDSRSDDINATGRSDVNILAVVNPQSHQILLLNTPRDYYVPLTISGGVRDKLTHAGIYGIDCSMGTLEALYDIRIPYYVRINFTGFENIVNALGGVTVYSDFTFETSGYQYVEGENNVNGEAALAFVRERYSFSTGDNQRGKNQMAMIQAILKKAMSPAILTNYQGLLNAISGSFATNFSYDEMTDFIKTQLNNNTAWNMTSYAVSGSGDTTTTYTYPDGNLYVMWPDDSMVQTAKSMIQQVINGEVPQG